MEASRPAPDLTAVLDRLWARFLPEMRERVAVLELAAAAQTPTAEQREAAHAAAHKLAGVLGTFSLARGTELARQLELLYADASASAPADAPDRAALAAELRSLVENRG